jgi:hypothetical protein
MANTLVKTLISSDGKRRLWIERRSDGMFQYLEEEYRLTDQALNYWDWYPKWPPSGLFVALEDAETEARKIVDWLKE